MDLFSGEFGNDKKSFFKESSVKNIDVKFIEYIFSVFVLIISLRICFTKSYRSGYLAIQCRSFE